jgi:hypothetical protein
VTAQGAGSRSRRRGEWSRHGGSPPSSVRFAFLVLRLRTRLTTKLVLVLVACALARRRRGHTSVLPIPTAARDGALAGVRVALLDRAAALGLLARGLRAPAAAAGVVVGAVLVADLAAGAAAAELAAVAVAEVEVAADDALVELRARDVAQRGAGLAGRVELDEAEAAWRPVRGWS